MNGTYLQFGGSRDGREPHLLAARSRGLHSVIVETPAFLALRNAAGRPEFDSTIAVAAPSDVEEVWRALRSTENIRLVLAGFEQYARCAHTVGVRLGLPRVDPEFQSPHKYQQRMALQKLAPALAQPRYASLSGDHVPEAWSYFPAVLKPVDGGGGLGVVEVENFSQLCSAYEAGLRKKNYDGSALSEWIVEEFVPGAESSLQGICYEGRCKVLARCQKIIAQPSVADLGSTRGFKEVAHVATSGTLLPDDLRIFAQQVTESMGYRNGPFHIDFREGPSGPVFLEMGFRLSGAAVTDLVHKVSGVSWGEASLAWMLAEEIPPAQDATVSAAAQLLVYTEQQMECAMRAGPDFHVTVEHMASVHAQLTQHQREALAADLSQHAGPIARLVITGGAQKPVLELCETVAALHHERKMK